MDKQEPERITVGMKFSNDIFITESMLIRWGWKYDPDDLEDGPFGRVLRIKQGGNDNNDEKQHTKDDGPQV